MADRRIGITFLRFFEKGGVGMKKIFMVDIQACSGCRLCEAVCSFEKEGAVRPSKSQIRVLKLDERGIDVPVSCQHCESPLCADTCPVNAITIKADGTGVLLKQDKCVGCRACVLVCPYGAITVDSDTGKCMKCDLCAGDPQCVKLCPKGALYYDDAEVLNSVRRHGKMKVLLKPFL
jgi:Fe-S-cluster-containing hydrogenase component 2